MSDSKPALPQKDRNKAELIELQNSEDVEKLKSILHPKEKVYRIVKCMNDGSDGVLAATDRRIIFCDQQFLSSEVIEFLYSEIAAVLSENQLLMSKVALVGIDKALYVEGLNTEHAKTFIDYIQDLIGQDFVANGDHGRHFSHRGEILNTDDIGSAQ